MTWKNEPLRHALSSKGTKTTIQKFHKQNDNIPPKKFFINWDEFERSVINECKPSIFPEYTSYEYLSKNWANKVIQLFWWSSRNDNWDYFNFGYAFELFKYGIKYYLMLEASYLKEKDMETFKDWSINNFLKNDEIIANAYGVKQYVKLYKKMDNINLLHMTKREKVLLMDEAIDTEHNNGMVFRHLNIGDMRKEFENEYGEMNHDLEK